MKAKYKVNNYEVRRNALKQILAKSPESFDKIINTLNKGKKIKLTVTICKVNQYDDGYESEGERLAYRMYGIGVEKKMKWSDDE